MNLNNLPVDLINYINNYDDTNNLKILILNLKNERLNKYIKLIKKNIYYLRTKKSNMVTLNMCWSSTISNYNNNKKLCKEGNRGISINKISYHINILNNKIALFNKKINNNNNQISLICTCPKKYNIIYYDPCRTLIFCNICQKIC